MKIEQQRECPYCHQMIFIEAHPGATEEELSELVVAGCKCPGAMKDRGMTITLNSIDTILGEGAKSKGFDYEIADGTISDIKSICNSILDGDMDRVTMVEPNGDRIKLSKNGNAVKIARISKKQVTM